LLTVKPVQVAQAAEFHPPVRSSATTPEWPEELPGDLPGLIPATARGLELVSLARVWELAAEPLPRVVLPAVVRRRVHRRVANRQSVWATAADQKYHLQRLVSYPELQVRRDLCCVFALGAVDRWTASFRLTVADVLPEPHHLRCSLECCWTFSVWIWFSEPTVLISEQLVQSPSVLRLAHQE
jgi:hypothetical protein